MEYDGINLDASLARIVHKSKGDINAYRTHIEERLAEIRKRPDHGLGMSKFVQELTLVDRIIKMEKELKAKFTPSGNIIILRPYVDDETQRIPLYTEEAYEQHGQAD